MSKFAPGLNHRRLVTLMDGAISRCQLDLSDAVVLTEAASGAYVVTPVLAAMAGARDVFAMCRPTQYGAVKDIAGQTLDLARVAAVESRVKIIDEKTSAIIGQADIITNSGHLRPIDAATVESLKSTAVIPLMYEAWEFRHADLDLQACRRNGIAVAGTNERHLAVDVFSFLGMMAIKLLHDAGIAVRSSSVLVLCNNPFASFISESLIAAGAHVQSSRDLSASTSECSYDAIVVALHPIATPVIDAGDAARIARLWPGAVVVQFWGDLDRVALSAEGVSVWPREAPLPGHMGILPSAIGPEPIVRLQAGGLKVGEVLFRCRSERASASEAEEMAERSGWGQRLQQ